LSWFIGGIGDDYKISIKLIAFNYYLGCSFHNDFDTEHQPKNLQFLEEIYAAYQDKEIEYYTEKWIEKLSQNRGNKKFIIVNKSHYFTIPMVIVLYTLCIILWLATWTMPTGKILGATILFIIYATMEYFFIIKLHSVLCTLLLASGLILEHQQNLDSGNIVDIGFLEYLEYIFETLPNTLGSDHALIEGLDVIEHILFNQDNDERSMLYDVLKEIPDGHSIAHIIDEYLWPNTLPTIAEIKEFQSWIFQMNYEQMQEMKTVLTIN